MGTTKYVPKICTKEGTFTKYIEWKEVTQWSYKSWNIYYIKTGTTKYVPIWHKKTGTGRYQVEEKKHLMQLSLFTNN